MQYDNRSEWAWKAYQCLLSMTLVGIFWISFRKTDGTVISPNVAIWSDFAMHISLINFYLYQPIHTILYQTPLLYGVGMPYPPLANTVAASLVAAGLPLYWAIWLPTIAMLTLSACVFLQVTRFLTGSKAAAALSSVLFFCSGGFGIVKFILNLVEQKELLLGYHAYTYHPDEGFVLQNFLISELLPQRSFLFSFPFVLIFIYAVTCILLWEGGRKRSFYYWMIAISMVGAYLSQFHSLITLALIMTGLCLNYVRGNKNRIVHIGVIFTCLALPLGAAVVHLFSGDSQVRLAPGGLALAQPLSFGYYLMLNWTPILLVSLLAWWRGDKRTRSLLYVGLLIFLVGHLAVFQPSPWDNTKLLTWAYFFFAVAAAKQLVEMMRARGISTLFAGLFSVVLTLPGILDIFGSMIVHTNVMYRPDQIKTAEFIEDNTPLESLFVSDIDHYEPASTFAGRRRLCGFGGWLWSYGLPFEKTCMDKKSFLAGLRTEGIRKKYGITHMVMPSSWKPPSSLRLRILNDSGFLRVYSVEGPESAIDEVK